MEWKGTVFKTSQDVKTGISFQGSHKMVWIAAISGLFAASEENELIPGLKVEFVNGISVDGLKPKSVAWMVKNAVGEVTVVASGVVATCQKTHPNDPLGIVRSTQQVKNTHGITILRIDSDGLLANSKLKPGQRITCINNTMCPHNAKEALNLLKVSLEVSIVAIDTEPSIPRIFVLCDKPSVGKIGIFFGRNKPYGGIGIVSIAPTSILKDTELQPHQRLISVNGKRFEKTKDVVEYIQQQPPKTILTFATIPLLVPSKTQNNEDTVQQQQSTKKNNNIFVKISKPDTPLGLAMKKRPEGVVNIVSIAPTSCLYGTAIQPHQHLVSVNGQAMTSARAFAKYIQQQPIGSPLVFETKVVMAEDVVSSKHPSDSAEQQPSQSKKEESPVVESNLEKNDEIDRAQGEAKETVQALECPKDDAGAAVDVSAKVETEDPTEKGEIIPNEEAEVAAVIVSATDHAAEIINKSFVKTEITANQDPNIAKQNQEIAEQRAQWEAQKTDVLVQTSKAMGDGDSKKEELAAVDATANDNDNATEKVAVATSLEPPSPTYSLSNDHDGEGDDDSHRDGTPNRMAINVENGIPTNIFVSVHKDEGASIDV